MRNKALTAPYLVWMAIFTIIPLGIVFYFAFTDKINQTFGFERHLNYCHRFS